jgi:hypothetical protein
MLATAFDDRQFPSGIERTLRDTKLLDRYVSQHVFGCWLLRLLLQSMPGANCRPGRGQRPITSTSDDPDRRGMRPPGGGSLDQAIYRACYPNWTIIPRGSCEEVLHAVVTMRANAALTRITCAGIVDADAYTADEAQLLENKGVAILPVSEIENLLLLPEVISAVAESEGFTGGLLEAKIATIFDELFAAAANPKNQLPVIMRYCRRRIDRILKKIDLSDAADIATLAADYENKTNALDITALAAVATDSIAKAITDKNSPELLRWYDNKGVLSIACRAKGTTAAQFESWIVRVMRNGSVPIVSNAIKSRLPQVIAT